MELLRHSLRDEFDNLTVHLADVRTPAVVYDKQTLREDVRRVRKAAKNAGCKLLYSPKANTIRGVLDTIADAVDGFAASSIFEARLSRDVLGDGKSVHITNPGMRPDEVAEVGEFCDYVALNSLSQWRMFGPTLMESANCGLRVNPGMSLVRDLRYDPCREFSKLGVPLDHLESLVVQNDNSLVGISGLHFHTNSEAREFSGLLATVRHLTDRIAPLFEKLEWVNLGGGYLFDKTGHIEEFEECVEILKDRFGLAVFIEPGTAIVRRSCYLVTSVVDTFFSDGRSIAVLDSSTSHWPEIFEYQFEPDVIGDTQDGPCEFILAGGTCLAGDLFGTYAFDAPICIGDKMIIANAGAYSWVKANYFNGINLPSVYAITDEGELVLENEFLYEDFARQCGGTIHANH